MLIFPPGSVARARREAWRRHPEMGRANERAHARRRRQHGHARAGPGETHESNTLQALSARTSALPRAASGAAGPSRGQGPGRFVRHTFMRQARAVCTRARGRGRPTRGCMTRAGRALVRARAEALQEGECANYGLVPPADEWTARQAMSVPRGRSMSGTRLAETVRVVGI
jgi:hypothetical protein